MDVAVYTIGMPTAFQRPEYLLEPSPENAVAAWWELQIRQTFIA
jgi:hypothetical protein